MKILFILLSSTIIHTYSLKPEFINFLQGYAFGVGMGDQVPEIMDCVLDVILIKPKWNIVLQEFKQKDTLSIWNGIVDILYTFDEFAEQCGNTVIGLNQIQKHVKDILKTPKLFHLIMSNFSLYSEEIQIIINNIIESVQDQDTYNTGYQVGELIQIITKK